MPSIFSKEEVKKLLLFLQVTRRACWLDCCYLLYSFALDAGDRCLVQDLGRRFVTLLDSDLELWT